MNNDPANFPNYVCASGSPGVVPSQFLFGLTVPRHFVAPNTQQWNLTLQRALGKQWVLEVGYVGTHAVHLRETRTSIQARLASPSNPIVLTDTRGNTFSITKNTTSNGPARSNNAGINGYNGFQLFADDAYSHYHSLQVTLSRRSAVGYFQGAYTFSKSTDATSSGNTALNTAFNDESTLDASRGLSDFDRKHRLSVSYRYDLSFFSKADGWKHAALANWAISGITIFQSGTPPGELGDQRHHHLSVRDSIFRDGLRRGQRLPRSRLNAPHTRRPASRQWDPINRLDQRQRPRPRE